jgi:hypothetical protein
MAVRGGRILVVLLPMLVAGCPPANPINPLPPPIQPIGPRTQRGDGPSEDGDAALLATGDARVSAALARYHAGDFTAAAAAFHAIGGDGAELYLAKALAQDGFMAAAIAALGRIAARADHRGRRAALAWIAELALRSPSGSDELADLVGTYGNADTEPVLAAETPRLRDALRYLLARHAYDEGRAEDAVARFGKISRSSALHGKALYMEGVLHLRKKDAGQALRSFRQVLAAVEEAPAAPGADRLRELAWLAIGRVGAQLGREDPVLLEDALAAYAHVDPTSDGYADSRVELAWALYSANRGPLVEELVAQASPALLATEPTLHVLLAGSLLGRCKLDDATAALETARGDRDRLVVSVDAVATADGAVLIAAALTSPGDANPPLARASAAVQTLVRARAALEEERTRSAALGPQLAGSVTTDLVEARLRVDARIVDGMKKRLAELKADADAAMENAQKLAADIEAARQSGCSP